MCASAGEASNTGYEGPELPGLDSNHEQAISADPDLCPGALYVEFLLDALLRARLEDAR
jgi:hypothetical protein